MKKPFPSDAELKAALNKRVADRMERLDELPLEPHVFSKRHERRMRRILKTPKRAPHRTLFQRYAQRAAVVLLTVTAILTTSVLGTESIRFRFFEYLSAKFEEYSTLWFKGGDEPKEQAFIPYVPTYLPKGFELVYEVSDYVVEISYEDKIGNSIYFMQDRLDSILVDVNTEGVETVPIKINDIEGFAYFNYGMENIVWYDDNYIFHVTSTLNRDELKKIAESARPKDFS